MPERLRQKVDFRCFRYGVPFNDQTLDWDLDGVVLPDKAEADWILPQLVDGKVTMVYWLHVVWVSG